MNLYEIATTFRADAEKLADLDLDSKTLADTLESLSGDLETKAQNVAFFLRNLESTALAIKQAEADMSARRKALENRAKRLEQYIYESMQVAGLEKISCPYFVISFKKNQPAVDVFEPGLIPAEYLTELPAPPPTLNKAAIKEAIKSGVEVPGARLTQSTRLEIK